MLRNASVIPSSVRNLFVNAMFRQKADSSDRVKILLPAFCVSTGGLLSQPGIQAAAPGFVGLMQINEWVPTAVAPGDAVPVSLAISNVSSQPGLTLAVG